MDFAKLNPWNWFKKEEGQDKALPVKRPEGHAGQAGLWPLDNLHSEIDRMFDHAFHSLGFPSPFSRGALASLQDDAFKPRVDISGSDKEYVVTAELPGVEEKDIELEMKGDALIIKADKRQEEKSEGKGYYRVERRYGSFQRVLTLPGDAETDNVKARYRNGVVTISLPRKAAPALVAKRIAIENG